MEPKQKVPDQRVKNKKRGCRGARKLLTKISVIAEELEDDDPFEDCNSQRWTLQMVLDHVGKHDARKATSQEYKGGPLTPTTFDLFPNSLIIILFRLYAKLEAELQNCLRIFYFGLENTKPSRFRNLTHSMHQHNIFYKYPWLTTDEKLREYVKVPMSNRKRRMMKNASDETKPFSEACKQYEIERRRNSKRQKTVEPQPQNIPNTMINVQQNKVKLDKHLLLSQEYQAMLSAINCDYQPKEEVLAVKTPKTCHTKTTRWSSPEETKKITPIMHFENRKIKLTSHLPLSLGDLIVLVSYFYKLENVEQHLLIEKMKNLETSKPNQASYLRQYVRTTCPLYNENEIVFKPLPQELIISEINMDLQKVNCIEDILENDFCVFDDKTTKDFDFGSAFL